MNTRCNVDGCSQPHEARGWCKKHYTRWLRTGDPLGLLIPEDGLGVCECPVSYPSPKCCTVCGYPSVHRMSPHIRDRALTRMPQLADQLILGTERRVS